MRPSRLAPLLALVLAVAPLAAAGTDAGRAPTGPSLSSASSTALSDASAGRSVTPVRARSTAPRATARTSSFAFLHVEQGAPVRWNPCTPVPWTFNPAGAPAGGLAAVQAALGELSDRTGLSFSYQGTSSSVPSSAYLRQTWQHFRPLLVGWSTSGATDLLAGRGTSTVGVTKVLWTGSFDTDGTNRTQIASGAVAFNGAVRAPRSGGGSWTTYALHELGHAVGLAHVADGSQVMNPVIAGSAVRYGAGDAAGLRAVGSAAGCLPDVR